MLQQNSYFGKFNSGAELVITMVRKNDSDKALLFFFLNSKYNLSKKAHTRFDLY